MYKLIEQQTCRLLILGRPPAKCECVYLVRCGYFRSLTKMAVTRTVRSAIAKNPMLRANFTALSSIQNRSYCR